MRLGLALLVISVAAFSGCSGKASSNGGELIVTSEMPTEADSETTVDSIKDPVTEEPKKGTRGHIAGVVVDEAIRPIEGATVKLPGMDLTEKTDRNGAFSFTDMYVGPYLINAEGKQYYGAETVVTVKADEFSRVKFVLTAVPPPEPYRTTQKFDGFTDVTDLSTFTLISSCTTCNFNFYAGGHGFRAMLIEATMDEYSGAGSGSVGSNNFYHSLRQVDTGAYVSTGDLANPLRVDLRVDPLPQNETAYRLTLRPESFPAPEVNKDFEVYITHFYNEVPAADWSFVAEDD